MNRREFLKSLLAFGVAVALPFDLATAANVPAFNIDTASDAEIDALLDSGAFDFEVNEYGTICFANFVEPTTREEAYGYSVDELQDVSALVSFVDSSSLYLQDVYEDYIENLKLDDTDDAKQKLLLLTSDDPDYGWVTWLELTPEDARGPIFEKVEEYLAEAPDCNDYDFLPDRANAQGAAYKFFQTEDWDELEQLGVVIVEGECPGSSYYAAELKNTVADANKIAKDLNVGYRFKAEGA